MPTRPRIGAWAAIGGLALVLASGTASRAATTQAAPILAGPSLPPGVQQGYGQVRPSRVFNGGDPAGLVYGIHWTSWGGSEAIGTGTGISHQVRIVAFKLGVCRGLRAYDAIEWYSPQQGQHFSSTSYIDACTGAVYPLVPGPRPNPTGALAALDAYWHDIGAGEYAKAYAVVDPETDSETEAQFAANERAEGIESVTFSGRVQSSSATTVTIEVASLTVRSTQDGCQSWTGSYLAGQPDDLDVWLIERSDITAGRCPT